MVFEKIRELAWELEDKSRKYPVDRGIRFADFARAVLRLLDEYEELGCVPESLAEYIELEAIPLISGDEPRELVDLKFEIIRLLREIELEVC